MTARIITRLKRNLCVIRHEPNHLSSWLFLLQILDFLILVGRLEDVGYNGDSAETALLVSDEDFDKALDYLKRLDGYKDIGFLEQTIHEAYNKANGDWDQALDFLTQGRWELKYYDMYMCVTIISAGIVNQMCHHCVIIHVLLCSHDSSCMSSLSMQTLLAGDWL